VSILFVPLSKLLY